MRLTVGRGTLRRLLWWTQRVLFGVSAIALGYCGFVLLDAWVFQSRASARLERLLQREEAARKTVGVKGQTQPPVAAEAIGPDGLIGRIEISRIGLSAVVFEGVGKDTLRRSVGHIPATGLPGLPGNMGLAGHRDTFFRPLRNIFLDDLITLTTLRGEFRYRVVSTRVVSPTEVSVLNPTKNETLTLVTCYPFYFVGAAPQRFIVKAARVN